MSIARYYVSEKNLEGASFPGVPLADIDEADWELYPKWLQDSVDASELYRKTNPQPTPRRTAHETKEEAG